ncbi:hypothetical protein CTheo_3232 [Ceratobasidium theobromae]|uniref:SHSP domain-containing protein n=1 Tax=Ceratobasidium theobromae TaxID=1582974 RepID=A0A5N5QNQ1_9AGAM|nr:hypothetical protein CTheo_3232 [Ceratobasidium theobromae]
MYKSDRRNPIALSTFEDILEETMSLPRNIFSDFAPLFRLAEDPRTHAPSNSQNSTNCHHRQAVMEVSEEDKAFVLRAELPGVQK